MKMQEKLKAIELRREGWMLPAIQKQLGVSKSTVSLWLRDMEINPRQAHQLLKGREYSRLVAGQKKKAIRIANTKKLFEQGKEEAASLANEPFFVAGIMLYWAEGAKTNEHFKFSNSDPVMITFMMSWLRNICRIPNSKFRISLHIHNLLIRPAVENYWSKITGVPLSQFQKIQIKQSTLKHRRNVLYNGTCTICVCDVALFRKMLGWKAGILDKFGVSMQI